MLSKSCNKKGLTACKTSAKRHCLSDVSRMISTQKRTTITSRCSHYICFFLHSCTVLRALVSPIRSVSPGRSRCLLPEHIHYSSCSSSDHERIMKPFSSLLQTIIIPVRLLNIYNYLLVGYVEYACVTGADYVIQ